MNLSQAIAKRFNVDTGYVYVDNRETFGFTQNIKCPLHHDESASAGIDWGNKMFNCFVCGAFPFWKLAKELEIEYSEIEETNENFADFLNNFVEDNHKVRPLVLRKQVEAYTNFLIERKLEPQTIEECGGYYVSDESSQDYGQLVFEYGVDKYGHTKTVKRRIIGDGERFRNSSATGEGDSKALFGRDFASRDTIILVEGITDYLTLWQRKSETYGIAASFGAKISKQQGYMLRNKIIFILFDRDYEGYNGALRAKEILKEFGCTVIILEIPEMFGNGQNKIDVNSAYCHSGDSFFDWLDRSIQRYSVFDTDYVSNVFLGETRPLKQFASGIPSLDSNLCGGIPVGLHAIAGREGIGKSSLLIYLGIQAAREANKVLLVSYELTKEQMWSRIASHYDPYHIWSEIEQDHVMDIETEDWLKEMSNYIRVERDWTIDEIKAASRNFDVIGIDYIQRMPYDGTDERAGIKRNTYSLGDLAYSGDGKVVLLLSSMPESGTTIFKETNVIKYAVQTGWILHRITGNVLQLENIKNTRGKKDFKVHLDCNYGHQQFKEVPPPDLSTFIKE